MTTDNERINTIQGWIEEYARNPFDSRRTAVMIDDLYHEPHDYEPAWQHLKSSVLGVKK